MNKERIEKAIRAELSYDELQNVLDYIYSKGEEFTEDFYNPNICIEICKQKLEGKIDDKYFSTWLVVMCNLLNEKNYELSDYLDGWSFNDTFPAIECRETIAYIKDYDLKLKNPNYVVYHQQQKMKVIYYRFEFVDHSNDELIYKCYIVDHKKKVYNVRIADNEMLGYDLSKNYCRIIDEEHAEDIRKQEADEDLDIVDCSKPEKQFCEAEEELINLFFNEEYRRDKELEL